MTNKQPVIAVFDIGKTNKKLFLFDQHYNIVWERTAQFAEISDEDGDACENLNGLRLSVFDGLGEVISQAAFEVRAVNFSTYGASFVYLDNQGHAIAPLYNYLKAYPGNLQKQFYDTYGGEETFSYRTASPVLGSLNSGMQLYRIKYQKPQLFGRIKYALHLPQYLCFLLSSHACSDITSIGCHTNLWDFQKNEYHPWVKQEAIAEKLAPLLPSTTVVPSLFPGSNCAVGTGLHDSSAALIPYLMSFQEPFVLISTGTWCITLNPFNTMPLTTEELRNDCLCYLTYEGRPVKAARLFAGYEHEQQVKRIADHFHQDPARYKSIAYNAVIAGRLLKEKEGGETGNINIGKASLFAGRDLDTFSNEEEAYHQLMLDIVSQQYASAQLVMNGTGTKRIFVDGGFGKNGIYMTMLAMAFPDTEVYAASVAQATAMGAALCIHAAWNEQAIPNNIIELKYYSSVSQRIV